MSELLELVVDEGETVEEGELEPVLPWLDEVEGVLCALLEPLPAPLPSLPVVVLGVLLWAIAIPAEKMTAVASVRIVFRILSSPERWLAPFGSQMATGRRSLPRFESCRMAHPQEATTER